MKNKSPLEVCLRDSLEQYLIDLNGMDPTDMYEMVINRVELPLLEVTMEIAQNNQSRAALMLGLTRNTLRKKLIAHKLLNNS